jgi:hypothetical protein
LAAPVFPSLATLLRLSNKSVIRRRFPVVVMASSRGSQATKPADNLYQQVEWPPLWSLWAKSWGEGDNTIYVLSCAVIATTDLKSRVEKTSGNQSDRLRSCCNCLENQRFLYKVSADKALSTPEMVKVGVILVLCSDDRSRRA